MFGFNAGRRRHGSTTRNHHSVAVVFAVGTSLVLAQAPQLVGCDDQPADGGVEAGICLPGEGACASANRRCRGRYKPLRNIRHEGVTLPSSPLGHTTTYELYNAGLWNAWCWHSGGQIYWRNWGPIRNVTSPWGGVVLNVGLWGTAPLSTDGKNALYRVESHARIGIVLPQPLPSLNANQYRCMGTRVYAGPIGPGGTYHSRNISYHACPGSALTAVAARRMRADNTVRFAGAARSLTGRTRSAVFGACFNAKHVSRYKLTGTVSARCVSVAKRAYESEAR